MLGSCVVDLVVNAPRRPERGETILATGSSMFVGGKGVNQAIGAARSGAATTLVGRIGNDPFGDSVAGALDRAGVARTFVKVDPRASTGIGLPLVEPSGENSIVFVPGANALIDASQVAEAAEAISRAEMLLLQLELPMATAVEAARIAARSDTRVLLNAAPVAPITADLLGGINVLVANALEARQLWGERSAAPLADIAEGLFRAWKPEAVVITLGQDGVLLHDRGGPRSQSAFQVEAVDAVGAGDAFCAGLAVELCRGVSLDEAASYGQAAAALTVMSHGAEPAIPHRTEIERLVDAGR